MFVNHGEENRHFHLRDNMKYIIYQHCTDYYENIRLQSKSKNILHSKCTSYEVVISLTEFVTLNKYYYHSHVYVCDRVHESKKIAHINSYGRWWSEVRAGQNLHKETEHVLHRNGRSAREINHTIPHRRRRPMSNVLWRLRNRASLPVRKRADAFHSTKNPENFEMRTNDTKVSNNSFQKNRQIVEFPKSEPID